mgnify:FL=1
MKKFIKFFVILILITLSIGLLVIGNGYNMYKNAIEEIPLQEKVKEIQSKENYVKLQELPQIYLDAVISVEE